MVRKERIFVLGLMALIPLMTFVLIIFLLSSIHAEYIVVTPMASSGTEKLTERIDQFTQRLDSYGQLEDLTVCTKKQGEMVFSPYDEAEATIYGIQENYCDFRFLRIRSGRRIDCTDVSQAKQIAVIDEDIALTLFHGQEAIGQTVSIGGADFEIIGICSFRNMLGEKDQNFIYIPISTVETMELETETMELMLCSETATLSETMIQSAASEWNPKAQLFSIREEVGHHFLPLGLAGMICMVVLMITCFRLLMKKTRSTYAHTHDILRHHYLRESMGSLILGYIPIIAGCLFVILGFYGLIRIFLLILTIFSTDLPEQLLSIAGWRNQLISFWKESAQSIQVRCYELEMIRIVGNISKSIFIIFTVIFLGWIALKRNRNNPALSA